MLLPVDCPALVIIVLYLTMQGDLKFEKWVNFESEHKEISHMICIYVCI